MGGYEVENFVDLRDRYGYEMQARLRHLTEGCELTYGHFTIFITQSDSHTQKIYTA